MFVTCDCISVTAAPSRVEIDKICATTDRNSVDTRKISIAPGANPIDLHKIPATRREYPRQPGKIPVTPEKEAGVEPSATHEGRSRELYPIRLVAVDYTASFASGLLRRAAEGILGVLVRILPKKYFVWREPKPFLTVLDEHERSIRRWWARPLQALFIFGLVMLQFYAAHFNPKNHPPTLAVALLLASAFAVFIAYFLPWLSERSSSKVTIFDRRILRSRFGDQQIRFADIASFEWRDAADFSTLIFTRLRGKKFFVGVPRDVPRDPLVAFLSERIPSNQPPLQGALVRRWFRLPHSGRKL